MRALEFIFILDASSVWPSCVKKKGTARLKKSQKELEPKMRDLNPVYECIVEYKRTHDGNSPSFRDIMRECGISSTSYMQWLLRRMDRNGLIRLHEGIRRGVEIVGGRWVPPEPR